MEEMKDVLYNDILQYEVYWMRGIMNDLEKSLDSLNKL